MQDRRVLVFILLYLGSMTLLFYSAFPRWAYDDPFITYRYAHNLSTGQGFVYNPGERVLSTTTPLFTLFLAFADRCGLNIHAVAVFSGAFGLSLGGIFLWDLARTWQNPAVGWAGLLLYPSFSLVVNTLSSETPLYIAYCLGAITFYARRKLVFTAVFAALAVLTRPDGLLVPVVLSFHFLLSQFGWGKDVSIRSRLQGLLRMPGLGPAVTVFLILTLAWIVFAWAYFGSPLPVTLVTKQQQGAMAISQRFGPGLGTIAQWYQSWPYQLAVILALGGLSYTLWRSRSWLLLFSWTGLYFSAYSILGVSRYFWYYAPLVPGFIAAIGLGFEMLLNLFGFIRRKFDLQIAKVFRTGGYGAVLGLLVIVLAAQTRSTLVMRSHPDNRYQIYRAAGEWLATNTPDLAEVGALEVGIIGFYAQRPMVDFAGLIQPEIAARLGISTTYEEAAIWAAERYQPSYLVLSEGVFPRLEQSYVANLCQLVRTFRGDDYGYSQNISIFRCFEEN